MHARPAAFGLAPQNKADNNPQPPSDGNNVAGAKVNVGVRRK